MSKHCPNCGGPGPCEACLGRAAQALHELETDRSHAAPAPAGAALLVWFHGPESLQRQHLTRVCAEWPGAIEILTPELPGNLWGCRLALRACDLGREPIELEVYPGRVMRAPKLWVATLYERLAER